MARTGNGYFLLAGQPVKKQVELKGASLYCLAPTVLELIGVQASATLKGRSILVLAGTEEQKSSVGSLEERVLSRLETLGY